MNRPLAHLRAIARTSCWKSMHMSSTAARDSPVSNSTSRRNWLATLLSASVGHSENQSMVQQLTREGKRRSLLRNASPTGLMQITM